MAFWDNIFKGDDSDELFRDDDGDLDIDTGVDDGDDDMDDIDPGDDSDMDDDWDY